MNNNNKNKKHSIQWHRPYKNCTCIYLFLGEHWWTFSKKSQPKRMCRMHTSTAQLRLLIHKKCNNSRLFASILWCTLLAFDLKSHMTNGNSVSVVVVLVLVFVCICIFYGMYIYTYLPTCAMHG